jgi:hypothetical protein
VKREYNLKDTLTVIKSDGLLSNRKVSKILNRSIDSINTFWKKYPQKTSTSFNGLTYDTVESFYPECPYLYTEARGGLKLCLWVDLVCGLEKFPLEVRPLIDTMAKFQLWLHDADEANIREKVCRILVSHLKNKK